MPDGSFVDDFLIARSANAIHVCNAPSPAATASIEIGQTIVAVLSAQISETVRRVEAKFHPSV